MVFEEVDISHTCSLTTLDNIPKTNYAATENLFLQS